MASDVFTPGQLPSFWNQLLEPLYDISKDLTTSTKEYGFVEGFWVGISFPQAKQVLSRVKKHVVDSDESGKQALAIRKSYAGSLNMIAVAGAIVAQIAITALSLDNLEATHWTVTAGFVISLISGCLSVYFACRVQLELNGLHTDADIVEWLTRPKEWTQHRTRVASVGAALMLVAPSQLLNWSLVAFFVGLGEYYGFMFTLRLGELRGTNANLAILLVYIIFSATALSSYYIPKSWMSTNANIQSLDANISHWLGIALVLPEAENGLEKGPHETGVDHQQTRVLREDYDQHQDFRTQQAHVVDQSCSTNGKPENGVKADAVSTMLSSFGDNQNVQACQIQQERASSSERHTHDLSTEFPSDPKAATLLVALQESVTAQQRTLTAFRAFLKGAPHL